MRVRQIFFLLGAFQIGAAGIFIAALLALDLTARPLPLDATVTMVSMPVSLITLLAFDLLFLACGVGEMIFAATWRPARMTAPERQPEYYRIDLVRSEVVNDWGEAS